MNDLEVSQIGGYPKIIHSRIFHYQPSILRGSPIPGALQLTFRALSPRWNASGSTSWFLPPCDVSCWRRGGAYEISLQDPKWTDPILNQGFYWDSIWGTPKSIP
jgi:hypothetical protein